MSEQPRVLPRRRVAAAVGVVGVLASGAVPASAVEGSAASPTPASSVVRSAPVRTGALASTAAASSLPAVGLVAFASAPALVEKAAKAQDAKVRAAKKKAAEARAKSRSSRSAGRTGDPRSIARSMVADRGWSSDQFRCLDKLWNKESNWRPTAKNPSSGAYGIPQSLPARKMASAGADWRTNPATQIKWGLGYIASRYGKPCAAWAHSQRVNWY